MACLWIQAVAGGHRPCCNAYGGFRYEVGCSHLEVIADRWDLYFVKVDRSGSFFWKFTVVPEDTIPERQWTKIAGGLFPSEVGEELKREFEQRSGCKLEARGRHHFHVGIGGVAGVRAWRVETDSTANEYNFSAHAVCHPMLSVFCRRKSVELMESGLAFRVGGGVETLVMEEGERDGITTEADRVVLQVAMKVNAVMEVGVMLSTDGSVSPCEGRPERASKAGCGAVIGAAPRLGWTDVGRIGHGLDRGATTSASELSAMTLGLRGILERIREARSNGINQKIRGEWVVFAMVDSETCVKGMEKTWRSRDDSWLVGEQDGDLLETINNLRWELWRKLRGLVVICQVPGHAKGVGGISAVAMVDAVAKWAAEGVPREPELLVRRSIATMMGVTDYGRVDKGSGDTLNLVCGAPAPVLTETWPF